MLSYSSLKEDKINIAAAPSKYKTGRIVNFVATGLSIKSLNRETTISYLLQVPARWEVVIIK